MKNHNPYRCVECSAEFTPDPRVGARQVTCGAAACQRERHKDRCRIWHARNRESGSNHYRDVVRPFREEQADYQRRWRLWNRLGEIRDEIGLLGTAVLARLRDLVTRAQRLAERAVGRAQSGVLAGEKLGDAVQAVMATIAALEQLETSTARLRELEL